MKGKLSDLLGCPAVQLTLLIGAVSLGLCKHVQTCLCADNIPLTFEEVRVMNSKGDLGKGVTGLVTHKKWTVALCFFQCLVL